MSALTPGTRVVVINSGHLSGLPGVVLDGRPGAGYETIVLLDKDSETGPLGALGFYAHELRVAK